MAAPLRAAALFALTRIGHHSLLPLLVDAMSDPQKEVRIAAAQALGAHGTESASLLLRLKARLGDNDSEVYSECLGGLLQCSPTEGLPVVSQCLDSGDLAVREAAILALGRSRLPEAFDLLKACWQQDPLRPRETLLLAMAMLRLPAVNEFLLDLIGTGPETVAAAALSALMIHRYDPRLRDRIIEAVHKSGNRTFRATLERDFRSNE
jgi:HEAT repeat protein